MSLLNADYRYQREVSSRGKQRAMTTIRRRTEGPERFLSLGAQDADERPRRYSVFMGPSGPEMVDYSFVGRADRAPTKSAHNTAAKQRRDRIYAHAQKLLDELNGVSRDSRSESSTTDPILVIISPPPPAADEALAAEDTAATPAEEAPQGSTEQAEPKAAEESRPAHAEAAPQQPQEEEPATELRAATPPPPPPEDRAATADKKQDGPAETPEEEAKPRGIDAAPRTPHDISGWMDKFAVGKSSLGAKNWKRRWFTMGASTTSNDMLVYQEKESSSKPLGSVPVHAATSRLVTRPTKQCHPEADEASGRDIVIIFVDEGVERKLLLRCECATEHDRWTSELRLRMAAVDRASDT